MPEAPNTSYDVAYKSAADDARQTSYLQQVLANTRAQQQQKADLTAKQDEQIVDTTTMEPDYKAAFLQHSTGMIPGTQQARFKDHSGVTLAHSVGKEMQTRRDTDRSYKALGESVDAMWPPAGPRGEMPPVLRRLRDQLKGPNSPARDEAAKKLNELPKHHAQGTMATDPVTAQPIAGSQIPYPKGVDTEKPLEDPGVGRYWTSAHNAKGQVSWISKSMNKQELHDAAGQEKDPARRARLQQMADVATITNRPEGADTVQGSTFIRAKAGVPGPAGPADAPPAGAAATVGQVSGDSATQAGAQSAAWLREKAKDPSVSPEDRAVLLKAAAAADKVQTAGQTQTAVATPPAAPAAGPTFGVTKAGDPGGATRKPGEAIQIKDAKELDNSIAGIETVRQYFNDPELQTFRGDKGLLSHALSRAQAKGQDWTGFQTGLPKNVQAARAALIDSVAAYRRSTSGVNVTVNESAFLENLLASDMSDPALEAKLAMFEGMVRRSREGLDQQLESSNRQAIPRVSPLPNPNAPPSTAKPPTAGVSGQSKQWTRDANNKLVPR